MKWLFLLSGTAVLGPLALSTPVSATTCEQAAAWCMKKGGVRDKCYRQAVASCKRTRVYVGYGSGKSFPASGDCGAKRVRKLEKN
jgi:hypothetical protein